MAEGIAKTMRKLRQERGLSQQQLGDMFGVSQEMIARIETGSHAVPSSLVPLVQRWIATGKGPSKLELGARYKNPGK